MGLNHMTDTIAGYHVKGRKGLNHWEALLEEWILCVERYSRIMDGEDAIYLYTERTCVGSLAAAAWRGGWIALEEFQLEKAHTKRPKWLGRADLYIASDSREEFIEAKYEKVSMDARRDFSGICDENLRLALDDVKATGHAPEAGELYIGVSFLSVYRAESRAIPDEDIDGLVECVKKSSAHAVAWCFPKGMREYQLSDNYRSPGVFLIAANAQYS